MLIIPAIDIKNGKVVRLYKGEFDTSKTYSQSPAAVAKRWQEQGAKLIHVVDLDGAMKGKPKNIAAIKKIASSVEIPVEVGGGIRTKADIEKVLAAGAHRVILGTKACEDEKFLKSTIAEFGEKIIVSIDAAGGNVATAGWQNVTDIRAVDMLKNLEMMGLKLVIYTVIERDGTMKGPDVDALREFLAAREDCLVISSGGISTLDDLMTLKSFETQGLFGVILGKALYEKKIDLEEAIRSC